MNDDTLELAELKIQLETMRDAWHDYDTLLKQMIELAVKLDKDWVQSIIDAYVMPE